MLAFLNMTTSLPIVKAWTKHCTKQAFLSCKKGAIFPESKGVVLDNNVMFYNQSLPVFRNDRNKGVVSRKRRALIEHHGPGKNMLLKLANYTSSVTQVGAPCWVCLFRPHHSQDKPTSVPIPTGLEESLCVLFLAKLCNAGTNSSLLSNCDPLITVANTSRWVSPFNWSSTTNSTLKYSLHFHRTSLVAEVCISRSCKKKNECL